MKGKGGALVGKGGEGGGNELVLNFEEEEGRNVLLS